MQISCKFPENFTSMQSLDLELATSLSRIAMSYCHVSGGWVMSILSIIPNDQTNALDNVLADFDHLYHVCVHMIFVL